MIKIKHIIISKVSKHKEGIRVRVSRGRRSLVIGSQDAKNLHDRLTILRVSYFQISSQSKQLTQMQVVWCVLDL